MHFRLDTAIDWNLLSRAISYYQDFDYKYVEVPWGVMMESLNVTRPPSAPVFSVGKAGYLVGSAEQSFIQMMLDGELKEGKYMAVTPCFRNEHDSLHSPYFIKLELIEVGAEDYYGLAVDAFFCHSQIAPPKKAPTFKLIKTNDGNDIVGVKTGIEVGSYGVREYKNLRWAYGTGLALPRFSKVVEAEL